MSEEEKTTELQKQQTQIHKDSERARRESVFLPPTDIRETDEAIVLVADMPGVSAESVEITLEDELLTVKGTVNQQDRRPSGPAYAEFELGNYQRSFLVSDDIDGDGIDAQMRNGVLTLTLPKVHPTHRKIEVKVG